jgi:hypothetical protein
MLFIWTAKEVTLANGASAPTTKADPVTVPDAAALEVELPQPAASSAATGKDRRARNEQPCFLKDNEDN